MELAVVHVFSLLRGLAMPRATLSLVESPNELSGVLERERAYHERLYSGKAQQRFARAAVREFRTHLCTHILRATGLGAGARVLSIGCGIGDTEIAMAPLVKSITGVDLSPSGIREARAAAEAAGVRNATFLEGTLDTVDVSAGSFDLAIAIFLLHHVPDAPLAALPRRVAALLAPGDWFYSLDPSRMRLSGAVGSVLIPWIMKQHQSPDERELHPHAVAPLFEAEGFTCRTDYYDFVSTPLAGLFTGWRAGYRAARRLDDVLIRVPGLRKVSSNFEVIARKL
jgi:cyclopropane fatty-acyl-phospholipid synthase-like methyltransferase